MLKRAKEISVCLAAIILLLIAAYLLHPILELAPIRQVKGTEFTRPYLGRTLKLANGDKVSQSFTAPIAGVIDAIGVYSPIPNRLSGGPVTFILYRQVGKRKSMVFKQTVDISRLANNEGLSIYRFRPIRVDKGAGFIIRLVSRATPAFFVFNSGRDVYPGGAAALNAKRLDIDLAFQVFYRIGIKDYWRHLDKTTPNLLGAGPLAAGLFLTCLAAAVLLGQLWRLQTI